MKITSLFKLPTSLAAAIGFISLIGTPHGFAGTNPTPYIEKTSSCPLCEEKEGEGTGSASTSMKSLSFGVRIGNAPTTRPKSFSSISRIGLAEGYRYRNMRDFNQLFAEYFQTGVINRNPVFLEFEVPSIDDKLYHPSVLDIQSTSNFERIEEGSGALKYIRQVVTDNGFTHINLLDPNLPSGDPNHGTGFRIRIWSLHDHVLVKSGTLYTLPVADPANDLTFKQPAGATDDNELLLVYRERFGATSLYEKTEHFVHDRTLDLLTKTTHEGPDTTGTIIRKEEVQFSNRGTKVWDYTITRTVSEALTTDGIGTMGALKVVSHTQEVYQDFSTSTLGGEIGKHRLMTYIQDFGTGKANLTTTYTYHNDPGNLYLHGRPKSILRPDQSWVRYEYTDSPGTSSAVHTTYRSYKDVTLANYTDGLREETILTHNRMTRTSFIGGQQISKEEITQSLSAIGETILTQKLWDGSEWATTITCFNSITTSKGPRNRLKWQEHADGTTTVYSYGYDGSDFKTTVQTGAGDRNGITEGKKIVSTYNPAYQLIEEERTDIPTNRFLGSRVADLSYGVDNLGRPIKWVYNSNPDDYSLAQYGCCGLESSRNRNGATATYFRDSLKRVYSVIRKRSSNEPSVTTTTDFDGLITRVERSSTAGTQLIRETTRSLSGLSTTLLGPDVNGDTIPETTTRTMVYNSGGGTTTTMTYPDQTTTSTVTFIDGRTKTTTDQEGNITTYHIDTHNINEGGMVSQITQPGGTQWIKSYSDHLGRTFQIEYPDGALATRSYHPFSGPKGSRGRLKLTKDPDENATTGTGFLNTYVYSADGEDITTTQSLPDGQSRITVNESDIVSTITIQGVTIAPALHSSTTVNGIKVSDSYRSLDGRIAGSISFGRESLSITTISLDRQEDHDNDPATPDITVNDGSWTTTTTSPEGVQSRAFYDDGLMISAVSFESGATLPSLTPADITNVTDTGFITGTSATHDDFGRLLTQTDARTGTTTMGFYLENNSLLSITAPGARITSFTYDKMGRRLTVDAPNTDDGNGGTYANITHTSYTDRGQIRATWGDQTYPRFYVYDAQGRMSELHTWQTSPTLTQATTAPPLNSAKTQWLYHSQRGWLVEKNYDGETDNGVIDPDYQYTAAGRLQTRTWERGVSTTYTYDQGILENVNYSDTTPDLAYTYDNFGRLDTVTRAGQLHADYDYDASDLVLTTEKLNQDTAVPSTLNRYYDSLLRPKSLEISGTYTTGYGYDNAGRLNQVWHQPTLDGNKDPQGAADFTYTYQAESGGLISNVTSPVHSVTNQWETDRNVLDHKTNTITTGSTMLSKYDYTVNDMGQRTNVAQSGSAFTGTTTIAYTYNFRGELIEANHSINSYDRAYEYDSIGNRKKVATGTLTLPVTNNYITNALNQYTNTPESVTPSHDLDGNSLTLAVPGAANGTPGTSKNASNIAWDAENRLISIDVDGDTFTYAYDYLGRRIFRQQQSTTTQYHFAYDGWNRITFYAGSGASVGTLNRVYTWGLDLSGSMQRAGGVGGLLATKFFQSTAQGTHYPCYDGNGNITQYLDSNSAIVAKYEYDPFGRLIHRSGTYQTQFRYRFSTKFRSYYTGLYDYGHRFYNPIDGRWPSRDPLGENFQTGEFNEYAFVGNSTQNYFDILGLYRESVSASTVTQLSQGVTVAEVAEGFGMTVPQLVNAVSTSTKATAAVTAALATTTLKSSTRTDTDTRRRRQKPCCCECITDAQVLDHGTTNFGNEFMWQFTIQLAREVIKTDDPKKTGKAHLRWVEKEANKKFPSFYTKFINASTPHAIQFGRPHFARSDVFKNWTNRSNACPISDVIELRDQPTAVAKQGDRQLMIHAHITNPPCCEGVPKSISIIAIHSYSKYSHLGTSRVTKHSH